PLVDVSEGRRGYPPGINAIVAVIVHLRDADTAARDRFDDGNMTGPAGRGPGDGTDGWLRTDAIPCSLSSVVPVDGVAPTVGDSAAAGHVVGTVAPSVGISEGAEARGVAGRSGGTGGVARQNGRRTRGASSLRLEDRVGLAKRSVRRGR